MDLRDGSNTRGEHQPRPESKSGTSISEQYPSGPNAGLATGTHRHIKPSSPDVALEPTMPIS
jgi:hypothetical protein